MSSAVFQKTLKETKSKSQLQIPIVELLVLLSLIPSFFIVSNSLSQLVSMAVFPCAVLAHLFSRQPRSVLGIPIWIVAAITISLLSYLWSFTPQMTFDNALRGTLPTINIMLLVGALPYQRAWFLFKATLGTSIVMSLIAVAGWPSAVHGTDDILVTGSWRGLYTHKNGAGPVGAVASLIFIDIWRRKGGKINLALAVCSMIFLLGTQSKTSILLTGVSFIVLLLIRRWLAGGAGRALVTLMVLGIAIFAGILLLDDEVRGWLFDDPYNFTGRVGIWQTALAIWVEQPWFGYGFRSVFGAEDGSLIGVAATPFSAIAPHPHNSYIQAMVGTGVVGLVFIVAGFVITPIIVALRLKGSTVPPSVSLCIAIIIFSIMRALFESLVLQYARPGWMVWPICIALLISYSNQNSVTKKI